MTCDPLSLPSPEERRERELCELLRSMGVDTVAVLLKAYSDEHQKALEAEIASMNADAGMKLEGTRRRGPKRDETANWALVFAWFDYLALSALAEERRTGTKIPSRTRWLAEWQASDLRARGLVQDDRLEPLRASFETKWQRHTDLIKSVWDGLNPRLELQAARIAPDLPIESARTKVHRFSTGSRD